MLVLQAGRKFVKCRFLRADLNDGGYALRDEFQRIGNQILKELSQEVIEDGQRLYRLRAKWGNYIGILSSSESARRVRPPLLVSPMRPSSSMLASSRRRSIRMSAPECSISWVFYGNAAGPGSHTGSDGRG